MNYFVKLYFFLFLVLLSFSSFAGPKIDTVYFQNGDRLTCEIKELRNNLLTVSTSDAGKFDVKWDRIDSLSINQFVLIELESGERLIGSVFPSDSAGYDGIAGGFGIRYEPHSYIIVMYPFKNEFFKRLSGGVGAGFSYTKANFLAKFDFNGNVKYTAEKYITRVKYDANWSDQKEVSRTQRHLASADYYRLLQKKFFYAGMLSAEQNSELGLDLRSTFGVVFGNNFIFNNHSIAFGALGMQVNREYATDSVTNNAEGVIALNYSVFRHSSPKLSLSIEPQLMPNLTDFERVRANINSQLRWEVLNDFYLKYTFYYTYDSKPLSVDAKKEDWSITFGIEYTFN